MNFFSNLNRKQKKEFMKLNHEEKVEILAAEISKKTAHERNKAISKAFMDGYIYHGHMLYKKFYEDPRAKIPFGVYDGLIDDIFEELRKAEELFKKNNPEGTNESKPEKEGH